MTDTPEDPEGAEEEAVARDRARDAGTLRHQAAAGDRLTAWIAEQQDET